MIIEIEKLQKGILKVKGSLSLCFQDSRLLPNLNVFDNIAYPLKISKIAKIEKIEIVKRVNELIKDFKLGNVKSRIPSNLSGKKIKKVALARCIIAKPKVLLLDKSTSNFDFEVKIEVREFIKKIHSKYKCTIVIITYDIFDSIYLSNNILILDENNIISYVSRKDIKKYKRTIKCFKSFMNEINVLQNKL